jgi:hypothetical protein
MSKPTASYLKVPYDLRPAKQIERRMLIETFQTLAATGFRINDYQYTGFGSIYFIDFVLFHRMLGIKRMLSIEFDSKIRKRVAFNKPFRCVDLKLGKAGDYIPHLSRDLNHILWLDYDDILNSNQLEEVWLAAAKLSKRSFLLITVDVERPGDSPKAIRDYFRTEAGQYLGTTNRLMDFVESNLVGLNRDVLTRCIESGLSSRPELKYIPLFSFLYADGHKMLTIGGMFGSDADEAELRHPFLSSLQFLRFKPDDTPQEIVVPRLTRKERIYMDKAMPAAGAWRPAEFELPEEYVKAYRELYRFFPSYAELLYCSSERVRNSSRL